MLICLGAISSTPALAHRLQVFASADGVEIVGSAYFAGGAKAAGATILIQDAAAQPLATLTTAADGSFRYRAQTASDHLVIADSGDGHQAQWLVTAAELAGLNPQLPNLKSSQPTVSKGLVEPTPLETAQLAAIEQAVARQIRPLREELAAAAARASFRDVLGGIGYIFGFTGILLWWRHRNPPRS
nr:hypothetical protein [Chromatium okenii]